jgi:hypothetical protein
MLCYIGNTYKTTQHHNPEDHNPHNRKWLWPILTTLEMPRTTMGNSRLVASFWPEFKSDSSRHATTVSITNSREWNSKTLQYLI